MDLGGNGFTIDQEESCLLIALWAVGPPKKS